MKYASVTLPERTVIVRQGDRSYVYLTTGVQYSSKDKKSQPKRVLIGKLDEDGKLIPNKNYMDLFGRYLELPCNKADYVSFGSYAVTDAICKENGMKELLSSVFDEDGMRILDAALYMVVSENNRMTHFEDYEYNHVLFSEKPCTDTAVGNLFSRIKPKDIDAFIKAWVKLHLSDRKIYIAYDSTNMNSVALNLELAEYGHAKDSADLPQVNVSVAYDQNDGRPVFYEMYPGSIIDNTECRKMVERAEHYGCKGIGFVLDRGYFSLSNIRYFEEHEYAYILMTKGNAVFICEAAEECAAVLKNGYNCFLEEHELYGTTIEKKLFSSSDRKQYVHVYYDERRAAEERIELNKRLVMMDRHLEEKKGKKIVRKEELKEYEKYYRLRYDDNGYFLAYQRKEKEVKKQIDRCGIFAIVTSEEMDAEEALNIYRNRDAVEKIFRMDKSYLGNDVFRVHNNEKLEGKVFVSFVALIIRNAIQNRLRPLYKKNRKEYTVPMALRQYERLGLTKLSDDKYHLRYALTNKQKALLEIHGINEKEYEKLARNEAEDLARECD